MTPRSSRRTLTRRRRPVTRWSNVQAAVLTGVAGAIALTIVVVTLVRQDQALEERGAWMYRIPWDASWPPLTISKDTTRLPVDVARGLYAFAGTHVEVLRYIPCYCGCQKEGHKSNADCYVRRSADGRPVEWNTHGLTCGVGADITGDVGLWREQGTRLPKIRDDIEREYAHRGVGTVTPRPPTNTGDGR